MKAGTSLEIQDSLGAKAEVAFAAFTAENGGARGFITVTAAGANQSQAISTAADIHITSKSRIVSEDEAGKVDIGQKLDFAGGAIEIDNDGILELPSTGGIRFGASGSNKTIDFDGNDNVVLAQGTEIQFGSTAANKLSMDASGNLTLPDAELRFGAAGRTIKVDASGNLELAADGELSLIHI